VNELDEVLSRVSPSKLGMFARCRFQFFQHYLLGISKPPSFAMAFGSGFDDMANSAYTDAMKTSLPDVADCQDRWAWCWDLEACQVEDWEGEDKGALLDQGVTLVNAWHGGIAVDVRPIAVQERLALPTTEGWEIEGIVDIIGEKGDKKFCGDLKTGGKPWRSKESRKSEVRPHGILLQMENENTVPSKARTSLQVPAYSLLTGLDEFEFHVCVRGKKGKKKDRPPDVDVIEMKVPESARQSYLRQAAEARAVIADAHRRGTWMPTGFMCGHFLCSRKYCGFWQECEREWGHRIPD
jgi:hypothetical protein